MSQDTSPRLASWVSTAMTMDCASTLKCRRSAARVSDRPNPSVPSELNSCGTYGAIWSCTARMKSDTATTGPGAWPSRWVT